MRRGSVRRRDSSSTYDSIRLRRNRLSSLPRHNFRPLATTTVRNAGWPASHGNLVSGPHRDAPLSTWSEGRFEMSGDLVDGQGAIVERDFVDPAFQWSESVVASADEESLFVL